MSDEELPEFSPEDDVIPDFEGDQLRISRLKAEWKVWFVFLQN